MSHPTNMDDARTAVKKQLLQTLMQQAVDDLSSESDQSLMEQIQEIHVDLSPLRTRMSRLVEEHVQRASRMDDAELVNKVSVAMENIDLEHYRLAVDQTVSSVLQSRIEEHIQEVRESAEKDLEEWTGTASQKIAMEMPIPDDLADRVTSGFDQRLQEEVQRVAQEYEPNVDELTARLLDGTTTFNAIIDQLREGVIEKIAEVAVRRLDDVDQVALEARKMVAFDNDSIVAASTMLRSRILQDIARRTTKSLGETGDVANEASDWVNSDDAEIMEATQQVRRLALSVIRGNVEEALRRTDEVVADVAPHFDDNHKDMMLAVSATRDRIVDSVSRLVTGRLQDTKQIAAAAAEKIPADSIAVQQIVKATLSLVVDDVIQSTNERLSQIEKLSSDARTRMPERLPEVESAAEILGNVLLTEVSDMAVSRLHDVERACNAAREMISDETPIIHAASRLVENLQQEVADIGISDMADTKTHASAARALVSEDHRYIQDISDMLRTMLVTDVTEATIASMGDAALVAKEAHRRVDENTPQIKQAAETLRSILITEIASLSVSDLADVDRAVQDAQAHVQDDDARMVSVRTVLRERIIGRILADTLNGLGREATNESSDADRTLFHDALKAVVRPSANWQPLSDMPEEKAEAAPEPEKSWSVSEIVAPGGDGHDAVLDVPTYEDHVYVYGIVDVDELSQSDIRDIEGIESGSTVYLCSNGDLSAVVSSVPAAVYGASELGHWMKDGGWVKEQVRRHAAVLSAIGSPKSIVPLKFGVVRASEEDVKRYLDAHRDAFHETLGRLSNKQEFSVRVRVDMHRLGEHVLASDARINDSLNDMSSGVAGFIRDELKLNGNTPDEKEMVTIIQNVVGQAHSKLESVSSESVFMNAPPSDPSEIHRVVLNATYLVSTAHEAAFDAQVSEMAAQFRHLGIEIQVSGPWAPYHFVHINDEAQEIPA